VQIDDIAVGMFCLGLGLYAVDILCIQNETTFNLSLRTNPINNEICIYYLADCTFAERF
jgi:hypothetical protein